MDRVGLFFRRAEGVRIKEEPHIKICVTVSKEYTHRITCLLSSSHNDMQTTTEFDTSPFSLGIIAKTSMSKL